MSSFVERAAAFFLRRPISFSRDVPVSYLAALSLEMLLSIFRGLRYLLWRNLSPGRIFISSGVVLKCKANIRLAAGVRLGRFVVLDGLGKGGLVVDRGTNIGDYSKIICSGSLSNLGGHVHIGKRVGISEFARIGGSGGVRIGDDTIVGQYFSIHSENHNFDDHSRLIREQGTTRAEVIVGSNCWIGAKVTVLAGVHIGDGCVVAAGSVVNKSVPPRSIVAGVPARIVRSV